MSASPRRGPGRYPKGPDRPKQCHIDMTLEEHRRFNVVAAAEAKTMSEMFREFMLVEIDRRYEHLGLNGSHDGNGKGKGSRKRRLT